jgi:hypothetical protein
MASLANRAWENANMMEMRKTLIAAALGIITFAAPAFATPYDFTFVSAVGQPSYDLAGVFTTGAADGPGFDITSISGTISGPNALSTTIAALVPGNATPPNTLTGPDGYTYDNIFLTSAPYFTSTGGALFTSNTGDVYNFYSIGGLTYLSTTDSGGAFIVPNAQPGVSGTFTATATPLPASWTMMLIGLVGLGFVGYRQGRKAALPQAA